MAELMPMIHAERGALYRYLQTLTPEQWNAPTWCEGWNVQQLVGHLTAAASITFGHFAAGFLKSGFNFDKFIGNDLKSYAAGTPSDALARFEKVITSTRKPPGPAYVPLGEIMVHGEDVRRALGSKGEHPEAHLLALADMYKKTGAPLHGKKRSAGLKFTATDVSWTSGDGPEVKGPAMSLIMAMVGRARALEDCTGDGVGTLRSRA